MHNVLLRWFWYTYQKNWLPLRDTWKASSLFSHIPEPFSTETWLSLRLLDVLVFCVFIPFFIPCGTLFSPQFQVTETMPYIYKCFPSIVLQAVINREGLYHFSLGWNIGMGVNLHHIWLESVDVVWIVSGWGFLKVIPVYTAPVEWLLHSAQGHGCFAIRRRYKNVL